MKRMTIKGKDLIERISDKEYSEDLLKELEKYEVKRPKSVWELESGDVCWRLGIYDRKIEVYQISWGWLVDSFVGSFRMLGLVHLTKERAELHARVLNTELTIKKWKRENDNVEFDWNNRNQKKYYLRVDFNDVCIDYWYTSKFANTIYFSSTDKIHQCIDYIGKERIKEWIMWEDNDQ